MEVMRPTVQSRWAWIGMLWLLVLLTGNLLHPLTHDPAGHSHDCLVCTLQSLPAIADDSGESACGSVEPLWEPAIVILTDAFLKSSSPYASHLIPRAPPV
jgi:hypothetical protein